MLEVIMALCIIIVLMLMPIYNDIRAIRSQLGRILEYLQLHENDDSSRVLKMDFGNRRATRFTDKTKQWINDRETASRG